MKPVVKVAIIAFALSTLPLGGGDTVLAATLTESDRRFYHKAFAAADRGEWSTAHVLAAKAKEKLPANVLRWMHMTRGDPAHRFGDIAGFIAQNPGWPSQGTLRRNAERAMDDAVPDRQILDWFAANPPSTTDGRLRLIEALLSSGQTPAAAKLIRETWRSDTMGRTQERRFRRKYRRHLTKSDHAARLDNLLWDGRLSQARRVIPLVDPALQKLAMARIALRASRGGVDWHIRRLPQELLSHPGFVYERVRWRRRKGRDEDTFELLKNVPPASPNAEKWWTERSILTRRLLEKGHVTDAYRIAHAHGLSQGARYAEAEWLSGWIALRYLRDGDVALRHFERIRQFVQYPISQARASYWTARALALKGDDAAAGRAYADAARHGTTYYGQLAAAERGLRIEMKDSSPEPSKSDIAAFAADERVRAIRMLHQIRAYGPIRQFARTLMRETDDPVRQVLVARLGREIDREDVAVRVGRRAYLLDIHLPEFAYPVLEMGSGSPSPALSHAIIRQESNFEKTAISRAGARGMMQLMPRTARGVAKRLKVRYSPRRLTSDPAYNIRLGRSYLSQMLSRFDGSYVLSIAAYNAGPAAAARWTRQFGDPRDPDVDVIDWIESIPYRETRNYVQRVLENIQVYRIRLGEAQLAEGIVKDLRR